MGMTFNKGSFYPSDAKKKKNKKPKISDKEYGKISAKIYWSSKAKIFSEKPRLVF